MSAAGRPIDQPVVGGRIVQQPRPRAAVTGDDACLECKGTGQLTGICGCTAGVQSGDLACRQCGGRGFVSTRCLECLGTGSRARGTDAKKKYWGDVDKYFALG